MQYKAVLFDLFETLVTEWGHPKYTKAEMCADLRVDRDTFERYWESMEKARYLGDVNFADSVRYVCDRCGKPVNDLWLSIVSMRRITAKAACFDCVHPGVLRLLDDLKAMGLPLAIVSNCAAEEVVGLKRSELYPYFDQVILSHQVGLQKPDVRIYEMTALLLDVAPGDCVFVGDGGSHELEGARRAGMTAVQAKWYTNQFPRKRESKAGFLVAEEPMEVLRHIR